MPDFLTIIFQAGSLACPCIWFAGDEDPSWTCLLVVVVVVVVVVIVPRMCNRNSAASSYRCVDTCRSTESDDLLSGV